MGRTTFTLLGICQSVDFSRTGSRCKPFVRDSSHSIAQMCDFLGLVTFSLAHYPGKEVLPTAQALVG